MLIHFTDLNVLEVDISVLAKVDNGSKEVEQSFKTLEGLKEFNQCSSRQLLVVF